MEPLAVSRHQEDITVNLLKKNILAAAAVVAILTATAAAQEYRFGVPKLQMQVVVKPDASVRIIYDITFQNMIGAHAIDIVDVGVPHEDYELGSVRAWIDDEPLREIRHSTVVSPGFEVHLGGRAIAPGKTGTLHVEFEMPEMVYQDTTRDDYASLRITPTWFGRQYVKGRTQIQVAIHLPESVRPEEALHQGLNFDQKVLTADGTSVVWRWPADRLDGPHPVAVSFPKRDLDRVVIKTKLDMLLEWFENSTGARLIAGMIFLGLLGVVFFRFSGGTGYSLFFILSVGAAVLFWVSPAVHLLSLPLVVVLIGVNEWYLAHRRLSYMPPIAEVEGGGIKRGLTAPEAAVLLEMPLAKVLSLVLFGMLKKGIVHQTQADPLTVEIDEAFKIEGQSLSSQKERYAFYRQAGQLKGVVVHKYEHPFLYLLQNNPGTPAKDVNFNVPVRQLIERVAARMKGFDLSDTKDYYRSIIRRAMQQAAAIGDVPQREKALDRHFEWILMDDDYPTVFTYGRPYWPVWSRGAAGPTPGASPAAPRTPGQTSFGDVAASFTGWAENTMGGMASAISPGSLGTVPSAGGFLDLSGADRVTGEFLQALGKAASSGGGGGGGGCACACAGCACACACAGGGR